MIEAVASVGGDVEVFVTVVVIITDRYTHSVADALEAGLFGYIFESAVALLVIEAVPVLRAGLLRDGALCSGIAERRAVDEEEIEAAVIVVVEERDARAHRLDEIFLCRVRGASLKMNARLCGDVDEVTRDDIGLGRWRLLREDGERREQQAKDV